MTLTNKDLIENGRIICKQISGLISIKQIENEEKDIIKEKLFVLEKIIKELINTNLNIENIQKTYSDFNKHIETLRSTLISKKDDPLMVSSWILVKKYSEVIFNNCENSKKNT